jgi:hypothetical protein
MLVLQRLQVISEKPLEVLAPGLSLLRATLTVVVDAVSFLHQVYTVYIQSRKSMVIL